MTPRPWLPSSGLTATGRPMRVAAATAASSSRTSSSPGNRHAGRREQPVRELLVAGDVDPERPGLARHRRADPLLVDPVPELDERLLVQPDPRDVAERRLVQDRLGRRPEGSALGEEDQLLELRAEVEARLGLDEVIDEADGELPGGDDRPPPRRTSRRRCSGPARRSRASCRGRPRCPPRAAAGARCARRRVRPRCPRAADPRSRRPCPVPQVCWPTPGSISSSASTKPGIVLLGKCSSTPRSTISLMAGS